VDLPFAALQPVSKLDDVKDYEGDLATWTIAGGRLLTVHATGSLCLWDLSAPLSEIV
jgi:hypothetical protein